MMKVLQNFDTNLKRLVEWSWRVKVQVRLADLCQISKPVFLLATILLQKIVKRNKDQIIVLHSLQN